MGEADRYYAALRPGGLPKALGLTAFPPIARFSGVVSNGNDYSFFWQFNGDYIVWEAFQNQASCTGIAGFFGER